LVNVRYTKEYIKEKKLEHIVSVGDFTYGVLNINKGTSKNNSFSCL